MKIYLILSLFLTVLTQAEGGKSCLYGWNLNDDESSCYAKCYAFNQLSSNVYCNSLALQSVNLSFDLAEKVLSMPSGDSMGSKASLIPACNNVTLRNDQYDVTPDGFIQIALNLMEISLKNVKKITPSNVTLCYPSSPQLLQCDVLSALPGSYKIINGTVLSVPHKKITAILGDFYVNEEAIAFFCAQSSPNVSFIQLPRCNMAVLQHTDYVINEVGSMKVLKANVTIKNPVYAINYSQHAIVCFPLDFDFLNCPLKMNVGDYNYRVYPNLTLLTLYYRSLVDPFRYYLAIDSEVTTCVNDAVSLDVAGILMKIYNYFYLLSSFTLLLTIILKFKMLVRNVHNRCLLCHLVSLIVMASSWGGRMFYHPKTEEAVSCYIFFVAYYYFNMAALLWLNVVAYDSWSFFSRMKTVQQSCVECDGFWACVTLPANGVRRFAAYSLYSWSVSAVLTGVILFMDVYISPYDFRFKIRPYVLPNCFFTNFKALILFYLLPLTVTTITNLIFLGLTIRIIHRASLGTEMVNVRRRKQILKISTKLFILISLCWTLDCVCYSFVIYNTAFQLWYLSLGLTSLQGFIISIIYCARKRVFSEFCACQNKPCNK